MNHTARRHSATVAPESDDTQMIVHFNRVLHPMPARRRRAFIAAFALMALMVAGDRSWCAEQTGDKMSQLPLGSHPPALSIGHFPSRLHAFVWRNWGLVSSDRMANTIGASTANIKTIARSLGLPEVRPIPSEQSRLIYITLVRRNWHLLPYEQLLVLVDMTAEELAVALREDDFLFIKLGNLKPRCEPLRYKEPSADEVRRAAEIKALVERHFPDLQNQPGEPRFHFLQFLSSVPPVAKPQSANNHRATAPRFIYSYFGVFGDPLLDSQFDPYPDGLLARLGEQGVNGVWLHVVLRDLAPGGKEFPEFGEAHNKRLDNLRALVKRAKKHGIDVYLYMNEPRAMPVAFFEIRPEMAGPREGDYAAMCTSDGRVRAWLKGALAHVFREVPDLGGAFTITASENLTHCASHGRHANCSRCSKRSDAEIIAEVNATIAAGVREGSPDAKVIIWDWGWRNHGDAPDIIARLPKNSYLMSVSEWSLPIVRGSVASTIGEYSISAVGPGPRATRHWQLAKEAGLKTVAKVQLNNSWELSAVPYLPVLDLVARHCKNLAKANVDGVMLSWSLGGYPSPNLQVAQRFADDPTASIDQVLRLIAQDRYGEQAAAPARNAWTAFSKAFEQYPYDGSLLYRGPQQFGPANLLYGEPTGYASTMLGFPHDDLNGWRGVYPADVLAAQFQAVAKGWQAGLAEFEHVVNLSEAEKRPAAEADRNVAQAARLHFASVANQVRFVMARDAWRNDQTTPEVKASKRAEMLMLLDQEKQLARDLYDVCVKDSRIGFEASNQYYYVPHDLIEKVINCEYLRQQLREP